MINISISHRSIKISAIFIAVLILATFAIPARSLETVKGGIDKVLPGVNSEIFISPFQEPVKDTTVRMHIIKVTTMGLQEIGETKHVWARVHLSKSNQKELGLSAQLQLLYLPGERLQSLFEMARINGDKMKIYVHEIEKPVDWDLVGSWTVYKVTSATVY